MRGAVGISDRGHSAASQLKAGDFDWDHIFGKLGVRWFHTGGIFAALSDTTAQLVIEAVKKARQYGTIVSYDLNYRPSLWKSIGGQRRAQSVNKKIARHVDVMIGNEEDFTACLGFEVKGADEHLLHIDVSCVQENDRNGGEDVSEFQSDRHDPARGENGDAQRLGRDLLDGRKILRIKKISRS